MLKENHVLDIVTEEGEDRFEFEGMGLGRATGEEIGQDTYGEGVEIYRTTDESYIIYVYFRDSEGELEKANYVKVNDLGIGPVRAALSNNNIYPGPIFADAIHNSFFTLNEFDLI